MSSRKKKPATETYSEIKEKPTTKKSKRDEDPPLGPSPTLPTKVKKGDSTALQVSIKSPIDFSHASVLACGSGDMYQLGLGSDVLEAKRPRPIPELTDVHIRCLSSGGASNAVVLVEPVSGKESVWTWGCNDMYVLGRRTHGESDQIVPKAIPDLEDIVQITVGDNHMLALNSKGVVYYWGCYRDVHGVLGFKFERKDVKQLTPELLSISLKKKIVQIGSGENSSFALTDTGKVYIWGDSRISQRTSSRTSTRRCGLQPSMILCSQKFKQIFAGGFHVLLLTTEGTLWAMGLNNYSQLGTGKDTGLVIRPRRVLELPPSIDIKMASAGQHHTLLLTNDGRVYSWGRGEYGQLGHGNTEHCPYPTEIKAFRELSKGDKVVQISAGGHHSLAVMRKGDVYAWGFGDMAQLGVGVDEDKLLPTKLDNTNAKSRLVNKKVVWASGGGQHSTFITIPKSRDEGRVRNE